MKDKGFTLVELLAAMVILALLIFVGTMTVSNIFDNTKDNYYRSLENTLSIAGNEYFNDNREDRPIDDYNFVDMETLVSHEYMDELMTYDGKEKCSSETGVYIYNEGNENQYEVCLVCDEYKSEGVYCNGKKSGTIHITGNINDKNGPSYNPLLSYSGTKWINASNIWIHFSLVDEGIKVSKYTIYNANGNSKVGDCTASSNKCSMRFDKTGSYYVEAFDGNNKVGNRKYFNVKLDNTPPTMDLKNLGTEFFLDNDSIVYDYENEVININDDNGYKEVKYTLTRYNPKGNEDIVKDKDIKDEDFKINASLESGKYDLYITVTDFAGNKATQRNTHITFYIKYNVDLQYFDNKDNRHDAGTIKVYTYGKYDKLPGKVNVNSNPQEVSWYLNANMVGSITTASSTVDKTGYHVLYGKEAKFKVTLGARCNNLTYNAENQQLAKVSADEQTKYRLVVYHDGVIASNQAKNAGTYMVVAMLNPGYTWDDGSTKAKALQCTIKKYPVEFNPNVNPCKSGLVYNGSPQFLTTSGSCGNLSPVPSDHTDNQGRLGCINNGSGVLDVGAVYNPISGTNAGEYKVKYHLTSSNFEWLDGSTNDKTYTCKISPKKVSVPANPCKNGLVYNSDEQYLLTIGDSTSAGGKVIVTGQIWHSPISGYSNQMAVPSSEAGRYDYSLSGNVVGKKAEEYPVKFVLNNGTNVNYTWSDGSTKDKIYVCKIDRYQIDVPTTSKCNTGLIYNGKEQVLTKDAGKNSSTTITVFNDKGAYTINSALRNDAGSQNVSYEIYDSQNYEWNDGTQVTKTVSCSIAKKEISVTWDTTSSHTWDNKEWGRSASVSTGISGETMTLNVTKKTDVGNYDTTATCSSVTNSKCDNYTLSNNTSTFSIVDKTSPSCNISISSNGVISGSISDNHAIYDYHLKYPDGSYSDDGKGICVEGKYTKTSSPSYTISDTGKYTLEVQDCSFNKTTCSVTVKKQIATSTCTAGNACSDAGCYERNSCRNKSCGCDTYSEYGDWGRCNLNPNEVYEDEFTECTECKDDVYKCHFRSCTQYKSCVNSSCTCKTYNTSISKCGCASWSDWSDWSDDNNCSAYESSDHSSKTKCRYA